MKNHSIMRDRQRPLIQLYRTEPRAAWVTDCASTHSDGTDPLHGELIVGKSTPLTFALHSAVGGESDAPVPGDILSAALASCLDSTIRVVADRFSVALESVDIEVRSEVDVRGTLCVDPDTPVGFARMSMSVEVVAAEGTEANMVERIVRLAEQCCVCLQTLQNGVAIDLTLNGATKEASHAA